MFFGFQGEFGEHAVVGEIRRDLRGIQPGAVGVLVEIITGRDVGVHALEVETPATDLGLADNGLNLCGVAVVCRWRTGGNKSQYGRAQQKLLHFKTPDFPECERNRPALHTTRGEI